MEVGDLYNAVKTWEWETIDQFVKNGGDINTKLVSIGPEAGYTAIHLAAMTNDEKHVQTLITSYGADINSVGEDDAQPIHLACLLGNFFTVEVLLKYGANPDAEIGKELYEKYAKGKIWSDEFGNKMTMMTFAVLNNLTGVFMYLCNYNANVDIKSSNNNKTLLMHAIENDYNFIGMSLVRRMMNRPELLNSRDINGRHAVHYFLPNERFGDFRYNLDISMQNFKNDILKTLIHTNADIDATIDSNLDTLLLNVAAYRGCRSFLQVLMNLDVPLSAKSRALSNATLPTNPEKIMLEGGKFTLNDLYCEKRNALQFILENLTFRREFGLFIPEAELMLMDQLVTNDESIELIIKNYQDNFINDILKKKIIQYGDQSVTLYDLVIQVLDGKKLKMLVKDSDFVDAYPEFLECKSSKDSCLHKVLRFLSIKIKRAYKQRILLMKIEKIEYLREAIPLPYELVLDVIEHLDNKSLASLVDAFYQESISSK